VVEWFMDVAGSKPPPCHYQDLFLGSREFKSLVPTGRRQTSLGFLTMFHLFEIFVSFVSVACL